MNSHKKRKFNTKKGISLVVAIALSAVLVLTTTTFISLALLQQKETGSELNTRQAYVSAKSALDMAKEMIEDGQINLAGTGPFYYVLYYNGTGEVCVQTCTDADLAKDFIKNTSYTVVGNSYIKITKDGTNCTVSAFSSEGKYTSDPNDASLGDLSMKFEATEVIPFEGTQTDLSINEGKVNTVTPPESPSGGDRFLLVGAQTNFSLMMGANKTFYNNKEDFQTLKQYAKYDKNGTKENDVIFIPYLNTNEEPITTQFPLVYTETVKIDSGSYRCHYKVYDEGVYFLGNYSGTNLADNNYPNDVEDVCFFTSNGSYGAKIDCKFVVVNNNMVAKLSQGGDNAALKVNYYGRSDSKTDGVIVYIARDGIEFKTYDESGTEKSKNTYSKGYYWLPNNEDLLTYSMTPIASNHASYAAMNDKNLYTTLTNEDGSLKELHAAFESESTDIDSVTKQYTPVTILEKDGTFQTSENTYSTTARKTEPYSAWKNYSIYCGPSNMPSANGNSQYYDLYCGDTFNYLWYNPFEMKVEKDVKMSIRSNATVLTIGGDTAYNESVYELATSSNKYLQNYIDKETLPTSSVRGPLTASREISGASGAEFWVRPYWGESEYTLTVMNDFKVTYTDGTNTTTYTIPRGTYKNLYTIEKFKDGINLFTDDAKNYFSAVSDSRISVISSTDSSIGWVTGTAIANLSSTDAKLTQAGKYVNFEASSGNLVSSATYSAEAIDCKFSHTAETNGATLKAKLVSIDTSAIKGDVLNIDTKDGSGSATDKSHCKVKVSGAETLYDQGHLLEVKQDMKLIDDSGKEWMELKAGFYFFQTSNTKVNILSKDTWTSGSMKIYYADKANEVVSGFELGNTSAKIIVDFKQGGYY